MQVQKARQGYKLVKSLLGKYDEIPEEWNVDEIQNHAKISTGDKNTQDKVEDGQYPFFVRSQNVERINSYSFDGEAILTAGDGDIGKIFHYINGKFDFHQRVYKISNFDNLLDGRFFYLYFSKYFLDRAISMSAKNTVDSIRMDMISKMQILLPPLIEQQKIASILSNVDSLISQSQKIIEQTQRLKKGLMQKLLTRGIGHTKFKKVKFGFGKTIQLPEIWNVGKLRDNALKIGSGITPLGGSEIYLDKGIPIIRSQNVHFDGLHLDIVAYISQQIHDEMKNTKLKPYDVLLNITGASIGRCTIVPKHFREGNVNQHVCIVRPKSSIHHLFLNYFLASSFMQNLINSVQGGLSRQGLNFKDLGNFLIPIPPLEEQQKIAAILSNVDSQIQKQQEYKSKLESLKKGLMQKLLTGQIRVKI